jgi:hypothetical protein
VEELPSETSQQSAVYAGLAILFGICLMACRFFYVAPKMRGCLRYRALPIFGEARVEGWLHPYSAEFIRLLAQIQTAAALRGAVREIGVHHGRLLILLLLCKLPDERAFAIHVFDRQELNTDRSGHGDLRRFLDNVRRWADGRRSRPSPNRHSR